MQTFSYILGWVMAGELSSRELSQTSPSRNKQTFASIHFSDINTRKQLGTEYLFCPEPPSPQKTLPKRSQY